MSKLSIIRESLKENAEVIVVGVKEQDYFPNKEPFGKWSHTVDFYVATRDALYSPEKLQDFMMNLVPKGLTPFQ